MVPPQFVQRSDQCPVAPKAANSAREHRVRLRVRRVVRFRRRQECVRLRVRRVVRYRRRPGRVALRPVRRVERVVPVVHAQVDPVAHEQWGPVVRVLDRRVPAEQARPVAREDLVDRVREP